MLKKPTLKVCTQLKWSMPGFTLIELLVVISIIALLLAILLPSLKSAHEAGQSAVCMANMDSIFTGAFMHAQDHEDYLPHFAYYASSGGNGEWWVTQVSQAIGTFEPGMFVCPADNTPKIQNAFYYSGATITMKQTAANMFTYLPVGYRGHCDLVWDEPFSGSLVPRKFTDWKQPERAIMMLEMGAHSLDPDNECFRLIRDISYMRDPAVKHTLNHDQFERHMGQSNVLFIDGHVDSLLPQDIGDLAATAEHYGNGIW